MVVRFRLGLPSDPPMEQDTAYSLRKTCMYYALRIDVLIVALMLLVRAPHCAVIQLHSRLHSQPHSHHLRHVKLVESPHYLPRTLFRGQETYLSTARSAGASEPKIGFWCFGAASSRRSGLPTKLFPSTGTTLNRTKARTIKHLQYSSSDVFVLVS